MSLPEHPELDFECELRDRLVAEIRARGLTPVQVADLADMRPAGVEMLLERLAWPLDVALRIAGALEVRIEPVVTQT